MSSTKRQLSQRSKQLRQKMIKRGFFDEKLKLSELYSALRMFLDWDLIDYVFWVDSENVKETLGEVLGIVEREIVKERLLQKAWMQVFVVHGFFQSVIKSHTSISQSLSLCLIEQLKHCNHRLLNRYEPSTVESSSPGFFSRSLSKIKRSFSSTSILKIFGSVQGSTTTNPKPTQRDMPNKMLQKNPPPSSRLNNFMSVSNKQQQKGQNRNEQINSIQKVLQTILLQYIKYLQHLITDWPTIHLSLWPYIVRTKNSALQKYRTPIETKNLNSQIIWKLFNYFHILSRINADFFKLSRFMQGFHVEMYCTLNFIADDLHMLYNPLVSFIVGQIKSIKWEEIVKIIGSSKDKKSLQKFTLHQSINKHTIYDSINKNSSRQSTSNTKNPSIKPVTTKLPVYVSQDVLELKAMIQQLGNVNQVLLYVYNGSFHSKNLVNKKKPSLFISLNDKMFDSVFEVAKMIEERESRKGANGLDRGEKRNQNPEQTAVLNSKPQGINMSAVRFKANKLQQMNSVNLKITVSKRVELTAETDLQTTLTKI